MNPAIEPAGELVPAGQTLPSSFRSQSPAILSRAGKAAVFATDSFLRTRESYLGSVCYRTIIGTDVKLPNGLNRSPRPVIAPPAWF